MPKGNPGALLHKVRRYLELQGIQHSNHKHVSRAYKELLSTLVHRFYKICARKEPFCVSMLDGCDASVFKFFKNVSDQMCLSTNDIVHEDLVLCYSQEDHLNGLEMVEFIREDYCVAQERVHPHLCIATSACGSVNDVVMCGSTQYQEIDRIAKMNVKEFNEYTMEKNRYLIDDHEFGGSLIGRTTILPFSNKKHPAYAKWIEYVTHSTPTQIKELTQLCHYDQRLIRKVPMQLIQQAYEFSTSNYPFSDNDGFFSKIIARSDFTSFQRTVSSPEIDPYFVKKYGLDEIKPDQRQTASRSQRSKIKRKKR